MAQEYDFPVWGTQGGGLVKQEGDHYVFVEPPADFPAIKIGDRMHPEWGLAPANEHARAELEAEFPDDFDVMGDVDPDEDDDGGESRFPDAGSHWSTMGRDAS